jgi:hypothetical protein
MTKLSEIEVKDIESRVQRISDLVTTAAHAWIDVGLEFASAKEALTTHAFERFLNDAGFTRAVADKLVCIGKCASLRSERAKQFVGFIDGWTTLYEVTKLSPNRVNDLWDILEKNPNQRLSRAVIRNVAQGTYPDDRSIVLGVIEIVESKLDRLTPAQIATVKSGLMEIQRLVDQTTVDVKFSERKQSVKLLDNACKANQTVQIVKTAA